MDVQQSDRHGTSDRDGPDLAKGVVTVLAAVGGFVTVFLGGLAAPRGVVLTGMGLYLLAMLELVRRLRAGDEYALAVPIVFVAGWWTLLVLGMMVLGWSP